MSTQTEKTARIRYFHKYAEKAESNYVRVPRPGRRTGQIVRITLASSLIMLAALSSTGPWLSGLVNAFGNVLTSPIGNPQTDCSLSNFSYNTAQCSTPSTPFRSVSPNFAGADSLSDLSLPKTVLSSVDDMIGAGGVVQASSDNLTLYNLGVRIRLLGGQFPHDELLGPDLRTLNSSMFWQVAAMVGDASIPLLPVSNNFTIIGTNRTGTFVTRTTQVKTGLFGGLLSVVYEALSDGSLRWEVSFTSTFTSNYRLVYHWSNSTRRAVGLAVASKRFQTRLGMENFTFSWRDVATTWNATNLIAGDDFLFTAGLGRILASSTIDLDPSLISSSSSSTSGFTFQRKVFYEPKGGYYFAFYYDGLAEGYSWSHDGLNWSPRQPMASGWPAYSDSSTSSPSVFSVGQTVFVAAGQSKYAGLQCYSSSCTTWLSASLFYAKGTISGSSISWNAAVALDTLSRSCTTSYQSVCSETVSVSNANIGEDSSGVLAFSYNWSDSTYGPGGICILGTSESDLVVVYNGQRFFADCPLQTWSHHSILVPSPGGLRVIYDTISGSTTPLMSVFLHGTGSSLPTVTPDADTYIDSSHPTTNYGGSNYLGAENSAGVTQIAYVHFNLPTIPPKSQFSRAVLNLTLAAGLDDYNNQVAIGTVSAGWTEYGLTWNIATASGGPLPSWPYLTVPSLNCGGDGGCSGPPSSPNPFPPTDVTPVIQPLYLCCNNGMSIQIIRSTQTDYTFYSQETSWPAKLEVYYSCCIEPAQTINSNIVGDFSALADINNGVHVAYVTQNDGNVNYAYLSPTSGSWVLSPDIFGAQATYPTLTIDYSTNDIYVLGVEGSATSSIVMKMKSLSGNWTDNTAIFPVTKRVNMHELGSNMISASATNSSHIALIWTEGNGPLNVTFASIPIQTVWSPYSSPSDPWDGNGLAPYGQFFQNLGESVSPSTGLLTVKQTDLSIAGRGIDLSITRVYTEPYAFMNEQPYLYEKYPWAPVGDGWQLNFPWMNNTNNPTYLHFSDGVGYRIPSNFWSGPISNWENHQGENFRLARNVNGSISLYDKTGTLYYFNTTFHRLAKIIDPTGNNIIGFSYNNNLISCITDSVGRTLTLSYSNGLLQSISQVMGSCSGGTIVRTVSYSYSTSGSLMSMTEPANRVTSYSYNATAGSVASWLLARIRYPTSWLTNYTYTQVLLGSTAYTYRVNLQKTGPSPIAPVRQFAYAYNNPVGDQVTNSTVTTYNYTKIVSYTLYAFSFAGISQNITDSAHNFVHGIEQRFGVNGEVPREIVLVSPTQGYSNYYNYDLWGNLIHSQSTISSTPSRSHESFSAYYNDGLPPGFNAFQDTFSTNNGTSPDNSWSVTAGNWNVNNHVYNGTPTTGPLEGVTSYSSIGKSDVSVQARVYLTRLVNTTQDQRFGIFTHFAGGPLNHKWGIVIHTIGSTPYLELNDEWYQWLGEAGQSSAMSLCSGWSIPLISTGIWYTFNMTVHGTNATGWVNATGQPTCSVKGNYYSNSPAINGQGFGVNAGAWSALFANVTVATVDPSITGTGFSGSFYQNGAPGVNVHNALAGTAELQNGTGSVPVEVYYGYTSWGGQSYVKQLYNSTSGTQWLTSSRTYDSFGNPATMTDVRGNCTYYIYSSEYANAYLTNQTQILKPSGTAITRLFSYNFTTGTTISSVDPNGYNTTYQYDILDRVTRVSYPVSGYVTYTYNDAANYVNVTNENLWLTQQIYDGLGRLMKTQRYTGGTNGGIPYSNQTYTYNWQNKVIGQKDDVGNIYNYSYDALGRSVQTKKPDGNVTQISYDDVSSYVVYADEYQNYRCNTYDRLGRLLSVVEFSDQYCNPVFVYGSTYVTNYTYDEVGNLLKIVAANSKTTMYSYDNMNRLTKTIYPDGSSESYIYDNTGNIISKTDRKGVQTSYAYDSLNRVSSIAFQGSTTTTHNYSYDKNSNLLQLQSQNATIGYTYDSRNRVTCETYAVNWAISGGPCGNGGGGGSVAAGTLITLADNSQVPVQNLEPGVHLLSFNVTTDQFTVSTITRMATVETSDMLVVLTRDGQSLRTDNATIQKLWVKQAGGHIGWLSVTQLRVGDNLFLAQSGIWTPVTSMIDVPGRFTMYDIYDSSPGDYLANGYLDPIKAPTRGPSVPGGIDVSGYSFQYYYSGETLAYITYNDYMTASYRYDNLGRVTSLYLSSVSTPTTFSYYPNDQIKGIQYSNALVANYTYNQNGAVTRESLNNTSTNPATPLMILNYQYKRTGTVAGITGNSTNTSGALYTVNELYAYDALGRLINSYVKTGSVATTVSYTYDNLGNRLSQTVNGVATYYSYNAASNELTSSTGGTVASYSYDPNGNTIGKNVTGTTTSHWTFTWNVQGELLKATNYTSAQGFYAYDGLGRRVESNEGSFVFYGYLGTETLADISSNSPENNYVYADGLRIAQVNNAQGTRPTVTYYHSDALGSTRLVTSSSKAVIFSDGYQPYGLDNSASGTATYKFTGKPVSQTTGLYYDYQRWYDPTIGRFISSDPFAGHLGDPQSFNPYVYVENSPTSAVDPAGMADCGWNPLSWGGCAENAGSYIANGWNGLPDWAKAAIIVTVVVVAIVATAGIAAPELLPAMIPLLAGDFSFLGGGLGFCGEDPAACAPDPPPAPSATDGANTGGAAFEGSGDLSFVDSTTIKFSQNSVSPYFRDGKGSIDELVNGLRSGDIQPGDVPPIRVVNSSGDLYTLDNRRLVAFQRAGLDVPIVRVPLTGSYASEFARKFTTTAALGWGERIIVKGLGGIWPP